MLKVGREKRCQKHTVALWTLLHTPPLPWSKKTVYYRQLHRSFQTRLLKFTAEFSNERTSAELLNLRRKSGRSVIHCFWPACLQGTIYLSNYVTRNFPPWSSAGCWRYIVQLRTATPGDCCFRAAYKCTYLLSYLLTYFLTSSVIWSLSYAIACPIRASFSRKVHTAVRSASFFIQTITIAQILYAGGHMGVSK